MSFDGKTYSMEAAGTYRYPLPEEGVTCANLSQPSLTVCKRPRRIDDHKDGMRRLRLTAQELVEQTIFGPLFSGPSPITGEQCVAAQLQCKVTR